MGKEFNFKSAICTSREQSERLLALGLKKETADISYQYLNQWDGWFIRPIEEDEKITHMEIPAWSLHRLWELANIKHIILDSEDEIAVLYDEVIMKIEQFIKEGYFNKEYLV